jgi:hypothetical protein
MAFTPLTAPNVVIAGTGRYAAIQERSRITIVELPSGEAIAGLADPALDDGSTPPTTQIGWVGSQPQLIVLRHEGAGCVVRLLEISPQGPRALAEALFATPMQLVATAGVFALVTGAQGTFVLSTAQGWFTAHRLPTRAQPTAACAIGDHFLLALPGSIEEWDPATRTPKRRLRLLRPAHITAIGRGGRTVWITTAAEPCRIDSVALVDRDQPRAWLLPEPIASVSGISGCDSLACVGAATGRVFLVGLGGRVPLRALPSETIGSAGSAGLFHTRAPAVLVAQAGRPLVTVGLDGRSIACEPPMARGSSPELQAELALAEDTEPELPPAEEPQPDAPVPPEPPGFAHPPDERAAVAAAAATAGSLTDGPPRDEPPSERPRPRSIAERFAARRQQRRYSTAS